MSAEKYYNHIRDNLNLFALNVSTDNKINLHNLNIYAENLYKELLNLLFDYKLYKPEKTTFSGIDLIDDINKIVVQISAQNTKDKIESSLLKIPNQFLEYNFKFICISDKKTSLLKSKKFKNSDNINFTPKNDIYDVEILLKIIFDSSKIEEIYNLIKNKYSYSNITPNIILEFSDADIRDVIISFNQQLKKITDDLDKKVKETKEDFTIIDLEKKNLLNNLNQEYYNNIILDYYYDFDKIDSFLSLPEIEGDIKNYYYNVVVELKTIIQRLQHKQIKPFEEIFSDIYKIVKDKHDCNNDLRKAKHHIYTFLYYMYCRCLIGKK